MFKELTEENFATEVAQITKGIVIFNKPLCPHCKNMEKCLAKVQGLDAEFTMVSVNLLENADLAASLGVERPPTLVAIKEGKTAGIKSGLMNPKEVRAWYQSA